MALPPIPEDHDLEEQDSYELLLLEDHPLRSHPTECCPGLPLYLRHWYAAVRKNWGERIFRIVCLLLMSLVVLQFLAILPYGITYLIPKSDWHQFEQNWVSRWPSDLSSNCLSVNPRAHSGAISQSLSAGCTGAKVNAWLHNDELLVGSSLARLDARHNLQSLYFQPLLDKLELRRASAADNGLSPDTGLFEEPRQSFLLMIEAKSALPAVFPRLVSQLAQLRQKGYLSHLNGTEMVTRPVTVVVTGRTAAEFETIQNPHNDIFFDASLDELVLTDSESSSSTTTTTPPTNKHPTTHPNPDIPEAIERDSISITTTTTTSQPSIPRGFYSATANFVTSVGFPHRGRFSRQQLELIRAQTKAAHQRGLQVRYEGLPRRRGKMKDLIWHALAREGADLIEVDWNVHGRGRWWRFFRAEGGERVRSTS